MDRGIWIWIQSVSDVVGGRMEGIFALFAAGMEEAVIHTQILELARL